MKKVLIKVEGMTCAGCASGLERYLNKQNGIIKAEVNLVMCNASIEYDEKVINLNNIDNYIKEAGFKSLGQDKLDLEKNKMKKERLELCIIVALGIITMIVSMGHMIGIKVPFFDINTNSKSYTILLFVLSSLVIGLSYKIIVNGIKKLLHKMPNMDTLISIGTVTSYIYSIYFFILTLAKDVTYAHKLYFEAAVMVLVFSKIGRYIENRSKMKTKEAIVKLMSITPNVAFVSKEGKLVKVSIDEIKKGDVVIARPGEKIAVDGTILNGNTHIDDSFITGESVPQNRKKGDKVVAGSINLDGYIEYVAEKIGKDTTVSEIVKMVVNAVNTKAPIASFADKISYYFVPTVIIIATLSFAVWLILGESFSFALNIFMSVLVVACPCALGLATPIAVAVATGCLAQKGLVIKNSKVLENTNKINTVVFDKTGTLTEGKLSISNIYRYTTLSENGILEIVGAMERKSEHPIAKAIVNRCNEQEIKLVNIKDVQNLAGYGMKAKYDGKEILVGSKNFMLEKGVSLEKVDEEVVYAAGNVVIFVSIDYTLVGIIELKDRIKKDAKKVVESLNKQNIEVVMLTGDGESAANKVASETGINIVKAAVLPKGKSKYIENLKKSGKKVMMIGDGINDAPSLVLADLGVSLETSTDIAIDSSDVVVMNNDLSKILLLLKMSKKTLKVIKENLFWAFIYNVIMLPISAGIFAKYNVVLSPMYSALAMTISSVTVVLNSLRLKKCNYIKKGKKYEKV